MGEMADDMIEGFSCSGCGVYFEQEHGYPVLCHHCWSQWTKAERVDYSRATEKEMT